MTEADESADARIHVLILGAGFGGLEVAAYLGATVADVVRITLVDKSDSFVFGFSKLDVLFGRQTVEDVRLPYAHVKMPSVEFRQETVTAIDPTTRHVTTDNGSYDPDILVVALGADYEPEATPGFVDDGHEFYSVAGAQRLGTHLQTFDGGDIVIAILGVPFKCPPAPYEAAFLLHDYLVARGVRDATRIELITPMGSPIPVSPTASAAIVEGLNERAITYTPDHRVQSLDPSTHVAQLKDGTRPYDLFIGVPVHRVPHVVKESGLPEGGADGWIAVDRATLATPFAGIYALGDCADAPVPRAGVFAESAARLVAQQIVSALRGDPSSGPYEGTGRCYLEFGDGRVGMVDANFLGGPSPSAPFLGPSSEYAADKAAWANSRRARWFAGGTRISGGFQ